MNYFKLIPALWKTRGIIESEIKEAKKMADNKPGWKKTEFWMKIITVDLPVIWLTLKGFVPPKTAALIEVGGVAAFAIINTIQKALENWKTIKQTTETTTAVTPSPSTVTTVTTPT